MKACLIPCAGKHRYNRKLYYDIYPSDTLPCLTCGRLASKTHITIFFKLNYKDEVQTEEQYEGERESLLTDKKDVECLHKFVKHPTLGNHAQCQWCYIMKPITDVLSEEWGPRERRK